MPPADVHDATLLLFELGGLLVLLALMARVAGWLRLSPIPLYLVAGAVLGEGGVVGFVTSAQFVETGAQLGLVLLLLMLGLEYSGRELIGNLRQATPIGLMDLVANYLPGFLMGLVLGLGPIPSLFLGGVTYISSSGVVAKVLADQGWAGNRETPMVLSVLVFEDLAMAVILPVLGAIAVGGTLSGAAVSVAIALTAVGIVLYLSIHHGERASRLAFSDSDEVNLLTVLGVALVVAAAAEVLHVSAAVGAFLVGIAVSGEAAHRAESLLAPLRDLFAAVFFLFFGLSTDPSVLPAVAIPVVVLGVVTIATKVLVAWVGGSRAGIGVRGRWRASSLLVARGEFSIIIAGLGVAAGAGSELAALAAGYVLLMATIGPVAARFADHLSPSPDLMPEASPATS